MDHETPLKRTSKPMPLEYLGCIHGCRFEQGILICTTSCQLAWKWTVSKVTR